MVVGYIKLVEVLFGKIDDKIQIIFGYGFLVSKQDYQVVLDMMKVILVFVNV